MAKIIELQEQFRRVLPRVEGCKDYREEAQLLERVDRLLVGSGLERKFVALSVRNLEERWAEAGGGVRGAARSRHVRHSERALRCMVLKVLIKGGYREVSARLAHSPLYRWFCRLEDFDVIRVPGKSTLNDYAHWLPAQEMEEVLASLTRAMSEEEQARLIGLENELDVAVAWVDTTCVEANVHFPTDWVLLRDGVRTIVRSVETIRRHGLRCRIPEPAGFLRAINGQAMAMSAAGRRSGSKRERKRCLRAMKKICSTVEEHGRRYRESLDRRWEQTDLSRKEAEVILRRLDTVLEQLPEARRQAHERIIGERVIANDQKILSLYEKDIHVVVRGKAGADVEFGNSLFVAEASSGYILDQRLSILQEKSGGQLCGVGADRGFDSKSNRRKLEEIGCFNGLCPRDPAALTRRSKNDELFGAIQLRRAQTEGRIGILKNAFLDSCPRAKGFAHRQIQVAWAVLAHNLWVLARQPWIEDKEALAQAA
jgi:IS5 family transposase